MTSVLRVVFKELPNSGQFEGQRVGLFHGRDLWQCVNATIASAHAILAEQRKFITLATASGGDAAVIGWSFDATPQPATFQDP